VRKTRSSVRIVGVPPGEAPLWVREKWVGLELPLARHSTPRELFTFGVLSGPRTWLVQMWGVVRGRARRVSGYVVEGARAVDILERSSPEAAAWWREHAPQYVAPRGRLVFHENVCEVVDA
jgi:hypothetical protein